jgi:hypothetical protein
MNAPAFQVLIRNLQAGILKWALKEHLELRKRKNQRMEVPSIEAPAESQLP